MSSPHQLSRSCYNATRNSFTNETSNDFRNGFFTASHSTSDGKLWASRALRVSFNIFFIALGMRLLCIYIMLQSSSSASQWEFNLNNFRIKFFPPSSVLKFFFILRLLRYLNFSSFFSLSTSSQRHSTSVLHDIKYPWHHKTFIMVFLYSYKIQIVSLW